MPNIDTPLVMIWRQVPSLEAAKSFSERMLNISLLGQDDDSLMYDVGTAILGLFGQAEFAKAQIDQETKLATADAVVRHSAARLAVAAACSARNFAEVNLLVNPASNVVFAADDLHMPQALLREEGFDTRFATSTSQLGETLPFYDDGGNLFSMTHFSDQALTTATGFVGPRLAAVLSARAPEQHHFVSINLMVSDIAKSESFYTDVLGLQRLQGLERIVTFDAGTSLLQLVPESTPRMVVALSRAGRLDGDWFVFHTKNIADKVNRLTRLGAKFPEGIEESAVGRMAYFNDPDGYALVMWQPPDDETLPMKKINFFPALNRILSHANGVSS
jgi:predicted enzyme related to lactoylglutathione lyase